jgi:hypothetical protein
MEKRSRAKQYREVAKRLREQAAQAGDADTGKILERAALHYELVAEVIEENEKRRGG